MSARPYPTAKPKEGEAPPEAGLVDYLKPYHVTVTKNTKGYSWEVSVHGEDRDATAQEVFILEAKLKERYGGVSE